MRFARVNGNEMMYAASLPKIAVPASNVAPSSVVGGAAGSENVFGGFSTNEPVSLLPKATVPGTDG